MGLTHEFYLATLPTLEATSEAVVLADELIHYIGDSLAWIPTNNPSTRKNHTGLHDHGITVIRKDSAALFKAVLSSWCTLFSLGPQTIELTGDYVTDENGTGYYEKWRVPKSELVNALTSLAELVELVRDENQCILHHGI